MTDIVLRGYQEDVLDEAREKLRKIKEKLKREGKERGARLLIQCPTGGGKTVMGSKIIQNHLSINPKNVARFMCHRDFLLDQTSKTFDSYGMLHSYIVSKGRRYNPYVNLHVAMVQTVKSRLAKYFAPSLCMWDECQHIAAKQWSSVLEAWENSTHIGLSATPIRLDGKGLDAYFDDIVLGPSVAHLIEIEALSDYTYYAPTAPDLSKIGKVAGDYKKNEVDAEMHKPAIFGDMVRHYALKGRGKRAVYFCTSIRNSMELCEAMGQQGFRFIHLDGDHSSVERENACKALARGDIDGLSNVDLFGEGFDLEAQAGMPVTIDLVGLGRPTKSLSLSRQQVGRGLRRKPYPAIILDHANHLKEHGLPDDEVEWSLAGAEKKECPTMQCPHCGAASRISEILCKTCGYNFIADKEEDDQKRSAGGGEREYEVIDTELQEVDKKSKRQIRAMEEKSCRTLADMVKLGRQRKYPKAEQWAALQWQRMEKAKEAKEHAIRQQMTFYEEFMK